MTVALETHDLVMRFGGFLATNRVNLQVARGARHALIGPNGAGKTTLVNLMTGVLSPTEGRIVLEGHDITAVPIAARVGLGIARTFQINQLFPSMSPLEAVSLAVAQRAGRSAGIWRGFGALPEIVDEAADILEGLHLADAMTERSDRLPYGKQRALELALALASRPKVLLLDEPAAGVPEGERHEILDIVASLPRDVSILLIEHDMDLVFSFAEKISVLVQGAVFLEGSAREIAADRRVREVYLGESADG
ncbi:MAG: ATP-binding cassette domain-containing protein [Alphaproteobacteria bacterium]|nr:ATP-binding cassette domain-containing protein [Alphaproteobacteria bacterium]